MEVKVKRIGSEQTFVYDKFKLLVGTISKHDTTSVYIKIDTYLKPNEILSETVAKMKRKIRANNYNIVASTFNGSVNHMLADYIYGETERVNKKLTKEFFSVEFTLLFDDYYQFKDLIPQCTQYGCTMFELIDEFGEYSLTKKA